MKLRILLVTLIFSTASLSEAQNLSCDEKKAIFIDYVDNNLKPKVLSNMSKVKLKHLPNGLPATEFINEHINGEKLFLCDLYKDSENQPEFSKPFWAYDQSGDVEFVNKIKEALIEYKDIFKDLENTYSVDKEIIATIWGKESKFGTTKGDVPVLQGLAFQAFRINRNTTIDNPGLWDKNVILALQILHSFNLTYEDFVGSWSGAFGHMQFIPSTYDMLAVDYDDDGESIHWLDDPRDALASAAKLLRESGWDSRVKWGEEVLIHESFNFGEYLRRSEGGKLSMRKSFWQNAGFSKNIKGENIEWDKFGSMYLVSPQGSENTSYLLSSKFRKLKAYNNSDAYSLATLLLAEAAKDNLIIVEPDINRRPLSRSEKKLVQALLNHNGQNAGGVDGRVGNGTKRAVHQYQNEIGLSSGRSDGLPSEVLLLSLASKFPEWSKNYIEEVNSEIGDALYLTYSRKIISYDTRPLSFHERKVLQTKLKEMGAYSGEIDGIAGKGTEAGVLSLLNNELPVNSSYMSRDAYLLIMQL